MQKQPIAIWNIVDKLVSSCIFVILFILVCSSFVQAAEPAQTGQEKKDSTWSVSAGAGVVTAPEFEGSDKYKTRMMPHVEIEFRDRIFLSTSKGLGVYFFKTPEWNAGVAANYNPGRKEKDSELLRGMGDIDSGVTLGGFAAWTPQPFSITLEADGGTGDVQGLRAKLSAGHSMALFDCLQWSNSVSTTFADSRYNDTFFGVSARQSRESWQGYEQYSAGSGIKDVAFSSSLNWPVTGSISVLLSGEYKRLTGPAADSPLVKAVSKNQGSGMLGIVYTFGN